MKNVFGVSPNELWYQVVLPQNHASETLIRKKRGEFASFFGANRDVIRVRTRGSRERHMKEYVTIRYYNKSFRMAINNVEMDFRASVLNYELDVQGGYLMGLIDSEGTVKHSGRIVIEMRPKSSGIIMTAAKLASSLGLDNSTSKDAKRDVIRLTIYGPASKVIKYCKPIHKAKRNMIINSIQYSAVKG